MQSTPRWGRIMTKHIQWHHHDTCQVYPVLLGVLGFHGTFWSYSVLGVTMAVYGAITIPDNRSDIRLISYRNIPVSEREALSNVIGFIYLLMIHYSRGLSLVKIEDNILGHSRTRIPEQSRLWSVSTTLIYYFVTLYVKVKLICIRIWNGRNDISIMRHIQ